MSRHVPVCHLRANGTCQVAQVCPGMSCEVCQTCQVCSGMSFEVHEVYEVSEVSEVSEVCHARYVRYVLVCPGMSLESQ